MTTAIASKTPNRTKQLTWTEDGDGDFDGGRFRIERWDDDFVLWDWPVFLFESSSLEECKEFAQIVWDRLDAREDELQSELEERLIVEEETIAKALRKDFAPKRRRRKRQNVR